MKSGDSISRQKAIDTANRMYQACDTNDIVDYYILMCEALEALPSAQSEIIRCKDCKHRCETEDGEYNPEDIVCTYWMSDGLIETDYCSYAERREK